MSELPTILVTNGWKADRNRKLTEIVIPSTVKTLQAPNKVTFMGKTLTVVPSTAAALQEFDAPNCTSIPESAFKQCTYLTSINVPLLTSLSSTGTVSTGVVGAFYGCTRLEAINFPLLVSISSSSWNSNGSSGAFYGCTSLTSISLPALTSITCSTDGTNGVAGAFRGCTSLTSLSLPSLTSFACGTTSSSGVAGDFYGCTSLTSVSLPSLSQTTSNYNATFGNCTALETVQLGSVGHAVTSLGTAMFKNCTQSNLTITIYTVNGVSLSGSPWGATNATIVYESA